MKKLIVGSIIFVLLLISVTACSTKQIVETPASSEISQGKRHNGGNMSRGERSSGEQGTVGKTTERLQKKVKDSGVSAGNQNGDISYQNGSENAIIGKVKSIVGNEVILIVANNSTATANENISERKARDLSNSEMAENESENKVFTETYLIPVGMAIGNRDFSSIKAGNTLKIFFGTDQNDGSKIITAVELR